MVGAAPQGKASPAEVVAKPVSPATSIGLKLIAEEKEQSRHYEHVLLLYCIIDLDFRKIVNMTKTASTPQSFSKKEATAVVAPVQQSSTCLND